MRIIIYGLGAVGGAIAAGLAVEGRDVIGIARGAMLDALRDEPLRVRTPDGDFSATFPVVAHPSDITFAPDDLILLTMKTQDTPAALGDLRAAGVREQPIFCVQNGVTNEDLALRYFPNVHGATVMMPVIYVSPGEVVAQCTPKIGYFDIGTYPSGVTEDDYRLAAALDTQRLAGFVHEDVMSSKRGKLLMNTRNVLSALLGKKSFESSLRDPLVEEAKAVFTSAGLSWQEVDATDPRRDELLRPGMVAHAPDTGGSTAQSLVRGTGHVETDFLNGEIARLGRLTGVPTPVNTFFTQLMPEMVAKGVRPGDLTPDDLEARYAAWLRT